MLVRVCVSLDFSSVHMVKWPTLQLAWRSAATGFAFGIFSAVLMKGRLLRGLFSAVLMKGRLLRGLVSCCRWCWCQGPWLMPGQGSSDVEGRADQGLPRPNSHLPPEELRSLFAVYLKQTGWHNQKHGGSRDSDPVATSIAKTSVAVPAPSGDKALLYDDVQRQKLLLSSSCSSNDHLDDDNHDEGHILIIPIDTIVNIVGHRGWHCQQWWLTCDDADSNNKVAAQWAVCCCTSLVLPVWLSHFCVP